MGKNGGVRQCLFLFKHDKSQKGDMKIRIKLKFAQIAISLDIIQTHVFN